MDFIAYLIERELLARRTICLPFIGVLSRVRMSARFVADRSHLTAPHDVLTLTADANQAGDEFIKLIAAEAGTSSSEAIATYNEWYAAAIDETGAVLTIDSVCSIDLVGYSIIGIDGSFEGYLSPLGDEPIGICSPIEGRDGVASESGTQATEVEGVEEVAGAPHWSVLDNLPIIEDVAFESIEVYQSSEPADFVQPNVEQPLVGLDHIERRAALPARSVHSAPVGRRAGGASSSVSLVVSVIVAVGAALYVVYYFASKYGVF